MLLRAGKPAFAVRVAVPLCMIQLPPSVSLLRVPWPGLGERSRFTGLDGARERGRRQPEDQAVSGAAWCPSRWLDCTRSPPTSILDCSN